MKKNFYQTVGERLRAARKRKGYTQQEVAVLLGRKKSSVSDNERGLNDIPISIIINYCKLYEIEVEDLVKDFTFK